MQIDCWEYTAPDSPELHTQSTDWITGHKLIGHGRPRAFIHCSAQVVH